MTQTTNNPQYKKNRKPTKGQVEEVKVTDYTESEGKSEKPSKSNPPTRPNTTGTYHNLFAKEYARINGKELEGAPTIEAANGNPVLVKYYQNYLLNEA